MTRNEALVLIKQYVKNENSIKHMLATEAIMLAMAKYFNKNNQAQLDVDIWGLTGLLHDLDMEQFDYKEYPELHGPETIRILQEQGVSQEILNGILAHNSATGKARETLLEKTIYAVDPLTGFITAIALVYPSKKLADVKLSSITKRLKELRFAAGANREAMQSIKEVGLEFEQFATIGLMAMQSISDDLGL